MRKIKLKVPANSLISAKQQIKAGADELYLAYTSEYFNNITFSGRMRNTCGRDKSEVDYNEFREIVKYAHANNVIIEMAANIRSIMDDYNGVSHMQKKYLDYVERGISAGADRIIVADIGNIILMKEHFPDIPVTASVYLETFNTHQVKLLESLGVKKIVLDHCVTIEEIETLVSNSNIDIEVFCQLGCSFMQYTCSLNHSGIKKADFGLPCRANYRIKNTGECINILDTMEVCAICALPKLREAGVSSLKIVGRDLIPRYTVSLTHIYSAALSMMEAGMTIGEILNELTAKYNFDWWKASYCQERSCKYSIKDYYI